jgi:hypothetical protein
MCPFFWTVINDITIRKTDKWQYVFYIYAVLDFKFLYFSAQPEDDKLSPKHVSRAIY